MLLVITAFPIQDNVTLVMLNTVPMLKQAIIGPLLLVPLAVIKDTVTNVLRVLVDVTAIAKKYVFLEQADINGKQQLVVMDVMVQVIVISVPQMHANAQEHNRNFVL